MEKNIEIKDEVLIRRFQDGDTSAFEILVNKYKNRIYNFIYSFVHDVDLAQDLTQDTFLKLFTHKNTYREIAKFSTWLYTIAGNLARTDLRKRNRRKTYSVSDLSTSDREFVISSDENIEVFIFAACQRPLRKFLKIKLVTKVLSPCQLV